MLSVIKNRRVIETVFNPLVTPFTYFDQFHQIVVLKEWNHEERKWWGCCVAIEFLIFSSAPFSAIFAQEKDILHDAFKFQFSSKYVILFFKYWPQNRHLLYAMHLNSMAKQVKSVEIRRSAGGYSKTDEKCWKSGGLQEDTAKHVKSVENQEICRRIRQNRWKVLKIRRSAGGYGKTGEKVLKIRRIWHNRCRMSSQCGRLARNCCCEVWLISQPRYFLLSSLGEGAKEGFLVVSFVRSYLRCPIMISGVI